MQESIQEIVEQLLRLMNIQFEDLSVTKQGDSLYNIHIDTEQDSGLLIGYKGETLFAFQLIVRSILATRFPEERVSVVIDIGDYKKKQEDNILNLATLKAKKVEETGEDQFMPPMKPYYRRLVHMHLSENEEFQSLGTESQGEGYMKEVRIFKK